MSEPGEKWVTSLKDEFLECPVCVEHFNQTDRRPRLLKTCLHAFCSQCIDQLLQKEGRGQLTCPMCRHVEKVKGKATSLPADPVRSKLVDFLHMKRQKKIKCTNCPDGNDADGRCDTCQMYLCKECINAHKRHYSSRDHHITSIEEALQVPIREFSQGHFCPKHPKQHIDFYCTTDDELCCVSCTVVDHKGHDFEKIQDAAAKRTSSLLESLQDVNKTKTGLEQRQKALKAKKNAVEQMNKESERNINMMIDNMKLQLDQRRNQLLSELQQESSAILSAIEKSSAAYDTTLAVIESTDTYFAQTKEKADDVEMLQMYPAIKRSVDALQSQPVAGVRINEDKLKFSPTQKTAFDGLVSQLGAFGRQDSPRQAVQHIPVTSRKKLDEMKDTPLPQKVTSYIPDETKNLEFKLPGEIVVKVHYGDIVKIKTDGIVNAANSELQHYAGVAVAIERACGRSLKRECERYIRQNGPLNISEVMHTTSGDLIALGTSYILHTVGPVNVESQESKCGNLLTCTFLRCLDYAREKLRIRSVAFPFISAGVYGVPLELCVESFLDAVVMYTNTSQVDTNLREIHLVNTDLEMVQTAIVMIKQHLEQGFEVLVSNAMSRLERKSDSPRSPRGELPVPRKYEEEEKCPICLEPILDPLKLDKCSHVFCSDCIRQAFKQRPACPVCGKLYGTVTGDQPRGGKMSNQTLPDVQVPGYKGAQGAISIEYYFPGGIQQDNHPNPGMRYAGIKRSAYLPNNTEGREVLRLLEKAFKAGVTFTIGDSRTTRQQGVITWNDIHHKTSITGGPESYGYPDPDYLKRVKEKLADMGITG